MRSSGVLALPDAECPSLPQRNEKSSAPGALTDLLKVLLTFKSEETGVARKLIANTEDLERIARGETSGVPALQGWRRALFGDAALDLVEGRIALSVEQGALRLRAVDGCRRSCGSAGSARRSGGGFVSASAPWFDAPQLTGDDPPPFTRIGPDRADPQFVLVCDHASNAVPAHMERLGLDQAELDRHIGWDIGAATVTESLSARLDAPAFLSGYSRLVVDCNRPLGSPTAMPAVSDGTAVPANRTISPAEAAARTDALFWPYHNAIAACLDRVIGAGAVPMLIAVHSFTPVFDGFARPWEIGLLYEHDDRLVQPLKEALLAVRPGPYRRRQRALRDYRPVGLFHSGAWPGPRPAPYRVRGAPGSDRHGRGCRGMGRDAGSSPQRAYTRRLRRSPSRTGCRPAPAARCNACPILSARKPTSGEDHPFSVPRYSGCGTILR